jgi:Ca2+-binding RTX toxin-like protein
VGIDTLTFRDFTQGHVGIIGAIVNLGESSAKTEPGDPMSVFGMENAIGSWDQDTLIGDAGPNVLRGNRGDDQLIGMEGDDHLAGGDGTNQNDGGDGVDTCVKPGIDEGAANCEA